VIVAVNMENTVSVVDGRNRPQRRFSMKKSKILALVLISLLMVGGLVLVGCGDECSHGCSVTWSNGKRTSGNACGLYSCSSNCIAYRNYNSNVDLPGVGNVHYSCNCD